MEYFEALGLRREPFSSSPDPDMFFRSSSQQECLHQLEIAIRLRRGLNVVLGEPGTGKTTLCRQLLRELAHGGGIDAHLILDPGQGDPAAFVVRLGQSLGVPAEESSGSPHELMERIKSHLFDQGVTGGRILCLVIDEGQKLRPESLEILRELLNYETNEFKLLQIAIFAQTEFMDRLLDQPNLADRVNYLLSLTPFTFRETWRMIAARLALAATAQTPPPRFSLAALCLLYLKSRGYPRKIVWFCHRSLLEVAARGTKRIGVLDVRRIAKTLTPGGKPAASPWKWAAPVLALLLAALVALAWNLDSIGAGGIWRRLAQAVPSLGAERPGVEGRKAAAPIAPIDGHETPPAENGTPDAASRPAGR